MNAHRLLAFAGLVSMLFVAGCGSSDSTTASAPPDARYALANQCFALRAGGDGSFVRRQGSSYVADASGIDAAEPFYLKPTALGSYMLYDRSGEFLAASGSGVTAAAAPSDDADWTVDTDADGNFLMSLPTSGAALSIAAPSLSMSGTASPVSFVAASGCTAFPEVEVNSTGTPFKGRGIDQPVIGFADSHVHITATDFLGHAHGGRPFHRFGVTQALGSCSDRHGNNGQADYIGNFETRGSPFGTHDTTGWPTFKDWPKHNDLTHEQTYYKWLERAWRGGERLLVNFLVENGTLCKFNAPAHGLKNFDCNEMDSVRLQVQQIHDLQDYIDAQEGGPGKGWFRIVTSPADARRVINDGKLAVVLGIEASHLFDCSIKFYAAQCDEATIDRELDEFYSLGVRTVFPMHQFNNAYGGNGIFYNVIDLGNFLDTGLFWQTYDCPDQPYFYNAGTPLNHFGQEGPHGADPLSMWMAGAEDLARYTEPENSKNQCNTRTLTDLGQYLIQRLMAKKMMIEIDHMELKMKTQVIDIAEAQVPRYPVMSSHGGHGGLTMDDAQRILDVGGLIFPYKGNGAGYVNFLKQVESLQNPQSTFGIGFGADTNGLGPQAGPRGAGHTPVSYPFTLFQGPDWGSDFNGMTPVTFDQQRSGERVFNTDVDGFAHYGMMPDFVEEVAIEGGQPALDTLFHSAEAYIEMWERVEDR